MFIYIYFLIYSYASAFPLYLNKADYSARIVAWVKYILENGNRPKLIWIRRRRYNFLKFHNNLNKIFSHHRGSKTLRLLDRYKLQRILWYFRMQWNSIQSREPSQRRDLCYKENYSIGRKNTSRPSSVFWTW